MSKHHHTPPPWKIFEGNAEAGSLGEWIPVTTINQDVARRICTIESGEYWSEEYHANVRLIAEAPELLEVLHEFLLKVPNDWTEKHSELYQKATDIVASVTGENS